MTVPLTPDGRSQPRQLTVQENCQRLLSIILNQDIGITGSGRTDAGVHAMGQTANFHANTTMDGRDIKRGINRMMKGPIVVQNIEQVPDDFHARFHAMAKTYHYHILNRKTPVPWVEIFHGTYPDPWTSIP